MSVSKAELKKIKAQNSKKGRRELNQFTVSGVRLLEESAKSSMLPIKVYHAKIIESRRCQELIERLKKAGVETTEISNKELDYISDTVSPQEIIATFAIPGSSLSKLYKSSFRRVLLCDRISDPGNLGTLARSALAFGFNMMLVTDKSAEIYNPKVIRSSAGALFHLPSAKITIKELDDFKKRTEALLVAATAQSRNSTIKPGKRTIVLAIGSEAEGLSNEILEMSDINISVSHNTIVESLNAAVAGSIIMNNLYQREENENV